MRADLYNQIDPNLSLFGIGGTYWLRKRGETLSSERRMATKLVSSQESSRRQSALKAAKRGYKISGLERGEPKKYICSPESVSR
jgi:hypothetical protein